MIRTLTLACALASTAPVVNAQQLLGIRLSNDAILDINPATGATSELLRADTVFPSSLAWNSNTKTLHTVNGTNELVTIDLETGAIQGDLPLLFEATSGLAYDPGRDIFFGVDFNQDTLFTIDPEFGNGTPVGGIGELGFGAASGLAYDAATDTLYSVDTFEDVLFTIDPSTGQSSPVGSLGFGNVQGITFHPITGELFGVDNETQTLITIDKATGAGTAIGSTGLSFIQGLAFTPAPGAMGLFVIAGMGGARRRPRHAVRTALRRSM